MKKSKKIMVEVDYEKKACYPCRFVCVNYGWSDCVLFQKKLNADKRYRTQSLRCKECIKEFGK